MTLRNEALTTAAVAPANSAVAMAATADVAPTYRREVSSLLYVSTFAIWIACLFWFHPRLMLVVAVSDAWYEYALTVSFVLLVEVAWLYGLFNLHVMAFGAIYHRYYSDRYKPPAGLTTYEPVAILYTTYNDFREECARSCLTQDHPNCRLYILDDSTDPAFRDRIDRFAATEPGVRVLRRIDRRGYKAGNLNSAIRDHVRETYLFVVDADELVPPDVVRRLLPYLLHDPLCGFVQANHSCNTVGQPQFAMDMSLGIDAHWSWYQPYRNRYGFVMLLGHGALLRRSLWQQCGGFPEIVSEDLAFALELRELGWHGAFADDVVCKEEFPWTVRAFRTRHVKWTRGTLELLRHYLPRLVMSRRIPIHEKLDVLFPTINLVLTPIFFLLLLDVAVFFPLVLGGLEEASIGGIRLPFLKMPAVLANIADFDFFLITVATILSPILCFIVYGWRTPGRMLRFLAHSLVLYASLMPLSTIAAVGYLVTGKARFLVTGNAADLGRSSAGSGGVGARLSEFIGATHPSDPIVRGIELAVGAILTTIALLSVHPGLLGVGLGIMLLALMDGIGWDRFRAWPLVLYVPGLLILGGIILTGAGLMGL